MTIPIINTGPRVSEQTRLNVKDQVGEQLTKLKAAGVRFGTMSAMLPFGTDDLGVMLALEYFEAAGCQLVSVNDILVQAPTGPQLMIRVLLRLPAGWFESCSEILA